MRRGELQKRANQKNLLSRALELSSGPEDMMLVQIMTLKQWLKEEAYSEAWNSAEYPHKSVKLIAERLLKTTYGKGKEFIKVTEDLLQVVVNADEINDNAVDKAIILLSEMEQITPGTRIEIGETINVKHSYLQK